MGVDEVTVEDLESELDKLRLERIAWEKLKKKYGWR